VLSVSHDVTETIVNTVGILQRQVTHLTRLVDDLLDVSRISEGRVTLQCAPVEVSALVAQSVENVSELVREKHHTLIIEASSDGLFVNGDHDRLVQSLSNLLVNAAKYSEPGGEIRIKVTREQAEVVIEVSDRGVGIAPEFLTDIFELFVQADRALDRSQGGLGIGLSVVKRLVEMHSGQVTASSGGVVILLDIGLPQMDGYEVAIRLRRLLDGVSIVALTGYGRPEDKERARQAGFDAHLVKPVDYAELNRFLRGKPVGE
jgi:signal transduction histidine kinase